MITVQAIDGATNDPLWAVAATRIDENGEPDGAGAFSNGNGVIMLPGPGTYFFEQQGYGDIAANITAPVTVALMPTTEELDEFTFYGERPSRSHWPLWILAGAILADQ